MKEAKTPVEMLYFLLGNLEQAVEMWDISTSYRKKMAFKNLSKDLKTYLDNLKKAQETSESEE